MASFSHTIPPLRWAGPGRHILTEDFWLDLPGVGRVVVEAGFDTDGASIPALLRGVYPADGVWMPGAIIHDWIYWYQPVSRRLADTIFLEALVALGIPLIRRQVFYRFLRPFGWIAWNKGKKQRESESCTSPLFPSVSSTPPQPLPTPRATSSPTFKK